jgi:redox-sensitive bicupin YhaK (pirin superfamily)
MSKRYVQHIFNAVQTIEGAGVHLKRAFGSDNATLFDPFLLFDDFSSDNPEDYKKGFPWHPHRGMETITYVIEGDVKHGDSLGNLGYISNGDVQWMTSGSGIIHEEMPRRSKNGKLRGFQTWVNLPASHKMISPRYQEIFSDAIPEINLPDGSTVRIIAGTFNGIEAQVTEIITDPLYLDIHLEADKEIFIPVKTDYTTLVYVYEGKCSFDTLSMNTTPAENGTILLFGPGDEVQLKATGGAACFIFLSGKPIKEPIAWSGPIVMNTQEEIDLAMQELKDEVFVK